MSESGQRFEGARFEAFEITHNPEILENKPEQHPTIDPQCEADVDIWTEKGFAHATISCEACPIDRINFDVRGKTTRTNVLSAKYEAKQKLKNLCGKWQTVCAVKR